MHPRGAAAPDPETPVDLAGISLPDSRTGRPLDLGGLRLALVVLIRHRY